MISANEPVHAGPWKLANAVTSRISPHSKQGESGLPSHARETVATACGVEAITSWKDSASPLAAAQRMTPGSGYTVRKKSEPRFNATAEDNKETEKSRRHARLRRKAALSESNAVRAAASCFSCNWRNSAM